MECLEARTLLAVGPVDPTFGNRGRVLTDFQGLTDNQAQAVALQEDGKIVVVGSAPGGFAVARYLPDGGLDSSFGNSGKVVTTFGIADAAFGVAIQRDGRIVVVGSTGVVSSDFALARYHVDGRLDTSFGIGGRVVTNFGTTDVSASDVARGVVFQPDDRKIVVVGTSGYAGPGAASPSGLIRADVVLARYTEDGQLDPSFGIGGRVTTNLGNLDEANAIVLQFDGRQPRYLVAGTTDVFGSRDFLVLRYLDNGALDPNFGAGGRVVTDFFRGDDTAYGIVVQPGGNILVVGSGQPAPGRATDFALARYTPSGILDTGFGIGGKVTTDFGGDDVARGVILLPDGGSVVVGTGGVTRDFALACYDAAGRLDPRSGNNGLVLTDLGGDDAARGVVLQRDGKIVVAGTGSANPNDPGDFALVRYLPLRSPPDQPAPNSALHEQFVARLYLDLLERPVDPGGRAFWTESLNRGGTRLQVVNGILQSQEYQEATVRGLYQRYLRRDVDPVGRQIFVSALRAGVTAEQVAAAIVGSPEYLRTRGGNTAAGFVSAVYQDVLNRAADPLGRAMFSQALGGGSTPGRVAAVIFGSEEYRRQLVGGWYERFLRRAPDEGGLAGFVQALGQGTGRDEVLGRLLASQEYFERSGARVVGPVGVGVPASAG